MCTLNEPDCNSSDTDLTHGPKIRSLQRKQHRKRSRRQQKPKLILDFLKLPKLYNLLEPNALQQTKSPGDFVSEGSENRRNGESQRSV